MQTLAELKAENAEPDEVEKEAAPQAEELETEEVEAAEEVETESAELVEEAEPLDSEEEDTAQPEVESWMQSEDDNSQPSDDEAVPDAVWATARKKFKAKADKTQEKHDEAIAQLTAKVDALTAKPANTVPSGKPKRDDFLEHDDPDEAYLDAVFDYRNGQATSTREQATADVQLQAAKAQRDQSVDDHYLRAAKLAKVNSIEPAVYKQSDLTVRTALGDDIAEEIMARMGPGSEKVMFNLGRSPRRLLELQTALKQDATGLSAMMLLGKLSAELTPPKRKTNAPAPAAKLKGGEKTTDKFKGDRKKYLAAHKSGDVSAAFSIKRAAKKAGANTLDW